MAVYSKIYGGETRQYQRKANALEKTLDVLQTPTQFLAGLTSASIKRDPKEIGRFLKQDKSFIDVLQENTSLGGYSVVPGFLLDVALDPLTYLGIGSLTAAGRGARAAGLAVKAAEQSGDLAKFVKGAVGVAKYGKFGTKLSEQARLGQRALFSLDVPFTNIGVDLVKGEKFYKGMELVGETVGRTTAGRTMAKFFGKVSRNVPEFMKLRKIQQTARIGKATADLGEAVGKEAEDFYREMKKLGMDDETARDVLRDIIELSGPEKNIEYLEYMDPATRQKYVRWVWQAEAIKRGLPEQLRSMVGGDVKRQFPSRRRRPNVGPGQRRRGLVTEGTNIAETLDAQQAAEAVRGRPLRGVGGGEVAEDADAIRGIVQKLQDEAERNLARLGKTRSKQEVKRLVRRIQDIRQEIDNARSKVGKIGRERIVAAVENVTPTGERSASVIKQGKNKKVFEDNGLQIPNLFALSDSWDFKGQMPAELAAGFEKFGQTNTIKAIRRAEEQAIAEYNLLNRGRTIYSVLKKYGWDKQLGRVSPRLRRAVNYINLANATYLTNERAVGLRINELASDLNYLHRSFTPEARAAYMEANKDSLRGAASAYDVSVKFGAQVQRDETLRDLSITEINRMGEAGQLDRLFGGRKVKVFEDEPFFSVFRRGTHSIGAIESAKLVKDSIQSYGRPIAGSLDKPITNEALQAGEAFLPNRIAEELGFRKSEYGRVIEDVAMPKDIVDLLNSHYERVFSPPEVIPLMRAYDAIQRVWKQITLPIWPAYHARNLASDLFMITHNADSYGLSFTQAINAFQETSRGLYNSWKGKEDFVVDLGKGGGKVKWTEFRKMLDDYGILDYSSGRELEDIVLRPRGLTNDKKGIEGFEQRLSNFAPFQIGLAFGQARQNATNSAYFLGLLRNGVTPEVAALEVKKKLFDFRNLTSEEKQILRRLIPFYSWMRHNIPYQLKAVIKNPKILTQINWAREAATHGEGPAGSVPLPNFLAQGLPIAVPDFLRMPNAETAKDPQFARLRGLLPVSDIMTVFNPTQEILNSLTPVLKTPFEMGMNVDTFQGLPLERYPGESRKFMGIEMSRRWMIPPLRNIRMFAEAENVLSPERTLQQKVAGLTFAKPYTVDTGRQTSLMYYRLRQEQTRVKKLMYQAAQEGRAGEVQKLRRYLLDINRNPHQLLQ